ncbi:Formyltransferase [Auriscalpium vulgare]|uniref:Formyltransferase n=1 Tax=Auriscalpium vulgare TaxID=40419 RepID=A0ACB8RFC2_9AGAM|nr:Formyltransferase [Auriscalpium vulgare]
MLHPLPFLNKLHLKVLAPARPRRTLAVRTRHDRYYSVARPEPFKILFFGRDEFSCTVFRELYSARDVWQHISIVTHPDEWVGRRRSKPSVSPLKDLGDELEVPVVTIPPKPGYRKLPSLVNWPLPSPFSEPGNPRHLLLTASFGRILPWSMLRNFGPDRRLNVHPSLLPDYRGPSPIQHTVFHRERQTGVSIIEMTRFTEGVDTGDIYGQSAVRVPPDSTFMSLRALLADEGGKLLVSTLRSLLSDTPPVPRPQVPKGSPHSYPFAELVKTEDSHASFVHCSAADLVQRHRAFGHHKPLTTRLRIPKLVQLHDPVALDALDAPDKLPRAPGHAVYERKMDTVVVRCAGGSVLAVPRLKTQDKNLISAKDWWNGVPDAWKEPEGTVRFSEFD